MRIKTPAVYRFLPQRQEVHIVCALLFQQAAELLHPFLGTQLIQPAQRDEALKPAELAPLEQLNFARGQQVVVVFMYAVQHAGNAVVPGALIVYRQHLADKLNSPAVVCGNVLLGAGAYPAVCLLKVRFSSQF